MNDHNPTRDAAPSAELPVTQQQATSGQQRRQLLRAVGAGGALVGAGLPFAAHATGRPHCKKSGSTHNYNPTASAVGSIIGSVTGTTAPVSGYHCTHYRDSAKWSTGWTNGKGRSLTHSLCADQYAATKMLYFVAFERTSASTTMEGRTCEEILRLYPTSDEAIFLGALFNANNPNCAPFAYTPAQVLALAEGKNPLMGGSADGTIKSKAVTLFRDYLSQKV
jgi:hypothetical protein